MKGRPSEWYGDPSTQRSRHSRSPLMRDRRKNRPLKRPYRSIGRSSAAGERLQDRPLRHSVHGKELVQEHSLPPQYWSHHGHPSLSPRDDGFRLLQDSVLPEHTSFNPSWRPSQSIKDKKVYSQINDPFPSSYLDTGGRQMLPQKPAFIEEGPSEQLFPDRLMDSTPLSSDGLRTFGGSVAMGIQGNGLYSRNDGHRDSYVSCFGMGIQDNKKQSYDHHRDQYDNMDRKQVYSNDLSLPKMPPSHLNNFISNPSSSILKEGFKGSHGLAPEIHRYPNDPLERFSYHKVSQSDTLRHDLPDDSLVYRYDELHRRGLNDHQQIIHDEPYKKLLHPSRMKVTSSTILKYNADCIYQDDSPNRNLIRRTFSDHQDSLYRDFPHDFHDVGAQQQLLTNSDYCSDSLPIKSSRDYETVPFEEHFILEKEYFPLTCRSDHKNGRPLLSDHDLGEQRPVVRTHNQSHIYDFGDPNIERIGCRNYMINGDMDEHDIGVVFVNGRHSSAPYGSEEMCLTERPVELSMSKSVHPVHSRYRKFSRSISTSDAFMPSRVASSMHAKNGLKLNLKRRLKHTSSEFHTSTPSERRGDLLRPYKYWKRGMHDKLGAQGGGTHESSSHFEKNDLREDSEEFKQQVQKAFLRYSKMLNESPHIHRIYQNQGNACSVLCSVCASSSKEFVDTNSLVIHAYHSLKLGLRTEHLGFHKALCVLLGWNWRVPPDNSRAYQSIPAVEVKAMQEDLILWPPLVIIHNSLIRGTTEDAKITTEGLEKILRDLGFGAGMTRVCLGNPAIHGVFAVKFMPTFSGLQEAQRLHQHFSDKNHGRHEFGLTRSSRKACQKESEGQAEEAHRTLYGYMAGAEDLDKVDHETKKRSVVKSKEDIQAIADATLGTD